MGLKQEDSGCNDVFRLIRLDADKYGMEGIKEAEVVDEGGELYLLVLQIGVN